jgi:hypothetical protein
VPPATSIPSLTNAVWDKGFRERIVITLLHLDRQPSKSRQPAGFQTKQNSFPSKHFSGRFEIGPKRRVPSLPSSMDEEAEHVGDP